MSPERIRVKLITGELGLGGTGKGVVSFASRLDRSRFDASVVSVVRGGPRVAELEAAGIPVKIGFDDSVTLARELEGIDVVHIFRHGITEPLVPAACVIAGVPVLIETNIFGARDRSADEGRFDCHLMVSMMCLMRYRRRGGGPGFAERHRVLYFPPEAERLRAAAPSRHDACRALGLDPSRPVVARLGRASDIKWRDLLVDMVPELLSLVPGVQVVFVGATKAKRARLAALGVLDRVSLLEPVEGDGPLATLYSACDVVVNASMIGESQGLVIAEAMALGIPVVTCSTPWADNAQVEFVRNGETGWVANHPREFAEAVADLLGDDDRRRAFGEAGRELVDRVLDPDLLTRQLEQLYVHHLRGGEVDWRPTPAEVQRFTAEYPARSRASFRRLSSRERAEAWLMRERETVTRRMASARMVAADVRRRLGR
jgi:glycosyltransferase involved in cell wall biosynthesis